MTWPIKLTIEEIAEKIKEEMFEEGGIAIWSEVKMKDLARRFIGYTEQLVPEPLEIEVEYDEFLNDWTVFRHVTARFKSKEDAVAWCKQKGLRIKP